MSDELAFLPQAVGLEYQRGPHLLTVVWVEYPRSPHRNHYWVSVFEQDAGDIWGQRFATFDEAKASFEDRRHDLERVKQPGETQARLQSPECEHGEQANHEESPRLSSAAGPHHPLCFARAARPQET